MQFVLSLFHTIRSPSTVINVKCKIQLPPAEQFVAINSSYCFMMHVTYITSPHSKQYAH